jgi:hypothetical protein
MMNAEQAEEVKRQALRCWRSTLPKLKKKKKKKKKKVHSLSNGKVKDALDCSDI